MARSAARPGDGQIAAACRDGIRLVCPAGPEWPGGLDELGPARPYALWGRGHADLHLTCARSVSMAASRAATRYRGHMAGEIAADLDARGWAIVSGLGELGLARDSEIRQPGFGSSERLSD